VNSRILDDVNAVSPEWLTRALRSAGVLPAGHVTAVSTDVVGRGQLGLVAKLTPQYELTDDEHPPPSLMMKLPRQDPGSRELGIAMGAYEAEVRFYQQIAPTVNITTPALYWADLERGSGRFTILLEDLDGRGRIGDQIAGSTPDEAAAALEALVGLQAARWNDPELRALGWLADLGRTRFVFANVEAALPLFLDRFAHRLSAEHIGLLERTAPHTLAWVDALLSGPAVVMHGDFRVDNMVFGADPAQPAIVFDWQTVRLGPPLVDVCTFFAGCLSIDQRRAHERDLLHTYHDRLVASRIAGFSFDDLWQGYGWGVFYGLLLTVAVAVALEQTDRGDELLAGMVSRSAYLAQDLESEGLLRRAGLRQVPR
jgi:aminoglycoside/choline kinase family phosphotransferase